MVVDQCRRREVVAHRTHSHARRAPGATTRNEVARQAAGRPGNGSTAEPAEYARVSRRWGTGAGRLRRHLVGSQTTASRVVVAVGCTVLAVACDRALVLAHCVVARSMVAHPAATRRRPA